MNVMEVKERTIVVGEPKRKTLGQVAYETFAEELEEALPWHLNTYQSHWQAAAEAVRREVLNIGLDDLERLAEYCQDTVAKALPSYSRRVAAWSELNEGGKVGSG